MIKDEDNDTLNIKLSNIKEQGSLYKVNLKYLIVDPNGAPSWVNQLINKKEPIYQLVYPNYVKTSTS